MEQQLNPDNVLVIGDLHLPFTHVDYLKFCKEQQQKFNCGTVVFIGDLADFHYTSFHPIEPSAYGCNTEYEKMLTELKAWQQAFPVAKITYGNHDLIPYRKGFANGLSPKMLKSWNQLYDAPKTWKFDEKFIINNVMYYHGTNHAIPRMTHSRISVVQGHVHSQQYVHWSQSEINRLFAMQVGSGVNNTTYAFNYGKSFAKKPILGCGVVLDKGKLPIVIPFYP
jgi:UDP-2,3-diacylglucosamine pyrophosphatase LpxH